MGRRRKEKKDTLMEKSADVPSKFHSNYQNIQVCLLVYVQHQGGNQIEPALLQCWGVCVRVCGVKGLRVYIYKYIQCKQYKR